MYQPPFRINFPHKKLCTHLTFPLLCGMTRQPSFLTITIYKEIPYGWARKTRFRWWISTIDIIPSLSNIVNLKTPSGVLFLCPNLSKQINQNNLKPHYYGVFGIFIRRQFRKNGSTMRFIRNKIIIVPIFQGAILIRIMYRNFNERI